MTGEDVAAVADPEQWDGDEFGPVPWTCACGLPMSRNPHPKAGVLSENVGYVWVCIPCTSATLGRWASRARRAERAVALWDEFASEASSMYESSLRYNIPRVARQVRALLHDAVVPGGERQGQP